VGTNSSKWDRDAHYAAMTMRELEAKRDWWIASIAKHDFAASREELAHIRMLIAQHILRKAQP
jgi:hypothetical protein